MSRFGRVGYFAAVSVWVLGSQVNRGYAKSNALRAPGFYERMLDHRAVLPQARTLQLPDVAAPQRAFLSARELHLSLVVSAPDSGWISAIPDPPSAPTARPLPLLFRPHWGWQSARP